MTQAGAVVFIDHAPRGVPAGTYRVKVTHHVYAPADGVDEAFTASEVFAVEAPRFALDAAAIDSTYPANGAGGEFATALPHVVLAQPSLPWLRSADRGSHDAPWLAVLLFVEDDWEGPKEAVNCTVAGLRAPGPGILSYPLAAPGYGVADSDACRTIDVPRSTFVRIAPSRSELGLLCHVRQVHPARKDGAPADAPALEFAVVIANRLPAPGRKHVAHLVSLEGLADLLPCSHGSPSAHLPETVQAIRLVSLASWSFEVAPGKETFAHVVGNAQRDVFRLPPEASGEARVAQALRLGYLPLAHRMRGGGSAPAWYRGPFAPYAPRLTVRRPIRSADAALRLDPATGMLDTSYAAAWQLGRMLALQDQEVAAALLAWKRTIRRDAIARAEDAVLRARLGGLAPTPPDGAAEPPPILQRWLARLRLLHGVPFPYLVPDERLLPPEAIRFFQLDANWMEALVDGAFSLGRSCEGDLAHERETAPLRAGEDEGAAGSGLLLRSRAVAAWPGVEVTARARGGTPLAVARRESLAPDLLLLLFDGAIREVELHQPAEALHFGFHAGGGLDERSGFTRPLRSLVAVDGRVVGELSGEAVPLPLRDATCGVVDIWALARAMRDQHRTAIGPTRFTAAEFAIEMVEGAGSVLFTVD